MVLVEIYPILLPIISLDGINGSLSVTLELNCAPSVLGVEINTSKCGLCTSYNSAHLPLSCRSCKPRAWQLDSKASYRDDLVGWPSTWWQSSSAFFWKKIYFSLKTDHYCHLLAVPIFFFISFSFYKHPIIHRLSVPTVFQRCPPSHSQKNHIHIDSNPEQ